MLTVYYAGNAGAKKQVVKEIFAIKNELKLISSAKVGCGKYSHVFKINGNFLVLTVLKSMFYCDNYRLAIDDLSLPTYGSVSEDLINYLLALIKAKQTENKFRKLHAAMDNATQSDVIICR